MKSTPKTPNSNRGFNAQFLCIAPLSQPLVSDRVVASIDSLRIKYTYRTTFTDLGSNQRHDTLVYLLEQLTNVSAWLSGSYDIHVSESKFRIGNYAYTVHYEAENGSSFAVLMGRYCTPEQATGYGYNKAAGYVYDAVIDFNPNKVPSDVYTPVMALLASWALSVTVQRFDLALDLPAPRSELSLVQRPGSGYQCFIDKKGIKTEYTGERQHHSAIKLYDKAADLGHPDLDVTRCEITIDPKLFKSVKDLFPDITTTAPVALSMGFSDLPFQVQAVILHPDLYDLLKASVHPNTWRKYKSLIQEYGQTFYTLPDDTFKEIDSYVKKRLQEFKAIGSPMLTA